MQNQARMLMKCKSKHIVQFRFQKTGKIKKNVKNGDFWLDVLVIMTLPWQRQISWTHDWHIKISERNA